MMTRRALPVSLLLAVLAIPAASLRAEEPVSVTADAIPVVDPADAAAADINHRIRERYASRNWRLGSLGGFAGSFGVQRRFWARSGLSFSLFNAVTNEIGKAGYDMSGLSFGWWSEHANRLFPVVWGWNLSAGPMIGSYFIPVSKHREDAVAGSYGAVGSLSAYAIVPIFSMLLDIAPHGLIPHLTLEWSVFGGRVGGYKVEMSKDLNGDGVNEYSEGDRFNDPGGGVRRNVFGVASNFGFVWIW